MSKRFLKLSFLFCLCCIFSVSNHINPAKAMVDEESESVGSMSVKQTSPSRLLSLEDPQVMNNRTAQTSTTSWADYLISPTKSVIQMAYNAVDFAVNNPKKATILLFSTILPMVSAARMSCECIGPFTQRWDPFFVDHCFDCHSRCAALGVKVLNCWLRQEL